MSEAVQRELAEVKEEIKQVKSRIKQLEQLPKDDPDRLELVALQQQLAGLQLQLAELLKKENRLAEGVAGAAGAAGFAAPKLPIGPRIDHEREEILSSGGTTRGLRQAIKECVEGGRVKGLRSAMLPAYYAPRDSLIDGILDKLPELKWMVLKSPPASGKTTALIQLAVHGLERYKNVYYFNAVGARQRTFIDGFQAVTGTTWRDFSSPPNSSGGADPGARGIADHDLLLVDEAQLLYDKATTKSEPLWDLLKALEGGEKRVHVVLAAIWGTHPSHSDSTNAPYSTPITAKLSQVIQLRPTIHNEQLHLALTSNHFMELVAAWEEYYDVKLQDSEVGDHIFSITGGYVGIVEHLLSEIGQRVKRERRSGHGDVDVARLARYSLSCGSVWASLQSLRCLMDDSVWFQYRNIMEQLLQKAGPTGQCTFYDADKDTVAALQRLGYLHHDAASDATSFLSPLHFWYYLFTEGSRRIPKEVVTTESLATVLVWAIERMRTSALATSLSRSTTGALLERAYQMEFYMALCRVLPSTFRVSPDVGTVLGCEGYVDFVIHGIAGDGKDRYWAVELLRDGLQAAAHAERFAEGKRYAAMLEAHGGCVSEYALIDFRKESSMPKVYRPDFIYVCINQSCTGGTLIANGVSTTLRLRNHEA